MESPAKKALILHGFWMEELEFNGLSMTINFRFQTSLELVFHGDSPEPADIADFSKAIPTVLPELV